MRLLVLSGGSHSCDESTSVVPGLLEGIGHHTKVVDDADGLG